MYKSLPVFLIAYCALTCYASTAPDSSILCSEAENGVGYGDIVDVDGVWYRNLSTVGDIKCIPVAEMPFYLRSLTHRSKKQVHRDLFENKMRKLYQIYGEDLIDLTLIHVEPGVIFKENFPEIILGQQKTNHSDDLALNEYATASTPLLSLSKSKGDISNKGDSKHRWRKIWNYLDEKVGSMLFKGAPFVGRRKMSEIVRVTGEAIKVRIQGAASEVIELSEAIDNGIDVIANLDSDHINSTFELGNKLNENISEEFIQEVDSTGRQLFKHKEPIATALIVSEIIGTTANVLSIIQTLNIWFNGDPVAKELELINEHLYVNKLKLDHIIEQLDYILKSLHAMQSRVIYEIRNESYLDDYIYADGIVDSFYSPSVQDDPLSFASEHTWLLSTAAKKLSYSSERVLESYVGINNVTFPFRNNWFYEVNIVDPFYRLHRKYLSIFDKVPIDKYETDIQWCWTLNPTESSACEPHGFGVTPLATVDLTKVLQIIMIHFKVNEILYQFGEIDKKTFEEENSYYANIYLDDIVKPLIQKIESSAPEINFLNEGGAKQLSNYISFIELESRKVGKGEDYWGIYTYSELYPRHMSNGSTRNLFLKFEDAVPTMVNNMNAEELRELREKLVEATLPSLQQSAMLAHMYIFLDAHLRASPSSCAIDTQWEKGICEYKTCVSSEGIKYYIGEVWEEEYENGYQQMECLIDQEGEVFSQVRRLHCDAGYIYDDQNCWEQTCKSNLGEEYHAGETWLEEFPSVVREYRCARKTDGWVFKSPGNWHCRIGYIPQGNSCIKQQCIAKYGITKADGEIWHDIGEASTKHYECKRGKEGWAYNEIILEECHHGYVYNNGQCEIPSCRASSGEIYSVGEFWREEIENGFRQYSCIQNSSGWVNANSQGEHCHAGYIVKNKTCVEQTCKSSSGDEYYAGESWAEEFPDVIREYYCKKDSSGWVNKYTGEWHCRDGYVPKNGGCTRHLCESSDGQTFQDDETWLESDEASTKHYICKRGTEGWAYKKLLSEECHSGFIYNEGQCEVHACRSGSGDIYLVGETWREEIDNGYRQYSCMRNSSGWAYEKLLSKECNSGYIYKDGQCNKHI